MDVQVKTFTKEHVAHLGNTLNRGVSNMHDIVWQEAFRLYNEALKERNSKVGVMHSIPLLGMRCATCYSTVYFWIIQ